MVEVLWGPHPTQRRGPKPRLSRERVVEAAIELADTEGLTALSMQRISEELGCAKMALYRHVPGKTELAALMLDTALGPPPALDGVPGGWRSLLREWSLAAFTGFRRHPWALEVSMGVRVLGPNELAWLETGLVALADTGLSGGERLDAVALILGHVRTLAQQDAASPASETAPEHGLGAVMSGIFADHGERFPETQAAFAQAYRDSEQDRALDFGLDRILDGLAVLINGRSRPSDG
jgi:AcrR family transcriptional regulator